MLTRVFLFLINIKSAAVQSSYAQKERGKFSKEKQGLEFTHSAIPVDYTG